MNRNPHKIKCSGTGTEVSVTEIFEKVNCPVCGRKLKTRFAFGGYDNYPRYAYLPYHKRIVT